MFYVSTDLPDDGLPLLADIAARTMGTLVGADLSVSHLPLLLDAPQRRLVGHLSRANPQAKALRDGDAALVMFVGPDGYVSPSAYPSKAENPRVVPTWNYASLIVRGRIERFDDPAELLAAVKELTERHEAASASPWRVEDAPAEYLGRMLRGIVGLRIRIEQVEARRKLSQNRSEADRLGVVAALERRGDAKDFDLAEAMRAF